MRLDDFPISSALLQSQAIRYASRGGLFKKQLGGYTKPFAGSLASSTP